MLHLRVLMLQLNILQTATKIKDPMPLRPKWREEVKKGREKRKEKSACPSSPWNLDIQKFPAVSESLPLTVQPLNFLGGSATKTQCSQKENGVLGFPGGSVVKNLPASAGNVSSIPGPGRSQVPQSD